MAAITATWVMEGVAMVMRGGRGDNDCVVGVMILGLFSLGVVVMLVMSMTCYPLVFQVRL